MKANVATIDRAIRIMLGLGLIAATLMGTIGPWGWLGLVAIATGVFRFFRCTDRLACAPAP
jgi:hypothetical protein